MRSQASLLHHRINEFGVFGTLISPAGTSYATLEHNFSGAPKLPPGTYECVRGMHQLDHGGPFEAFEITGVPGHKGILIHVGNFNHDSDGCVLIGMSDNGTSLGRSKEAFNAFMSELAGQTSFTLIVS